MYSKDDDKGRWEVMGLIKRIMFVVLDIPVLLAMVLLGMVNVIRGRTCDRQWYT